MCQTRLIIHSTRAKSSLASFSQSHALGRTKFKGRMNGLGVDWTNGLNVRLIALNKVNFYLIPDQGSLVQDVHQKTNGNISGSTAEALHVPCTGGREKRRCRPQSHRCPTWLPGCAPPQNTTFDPASLSRVGPELHGFEKSDALM
jgi:hypothetical protein